MEDTANSGWQLLNSQVAAEVSLTLLATIAVGLRLAMRRLKGVKLRADDYTIIAAWVAATAFACFNSWALTHHVLSVPEMSMSEEETSRHGQVVFVTTILGNAAYGLVKLSAALFYKSIFVGQRFALASNIYIGLVAAWMVSALLGQILSLLPVSSWWAPPYVPSRSINYGAYLLAMSTIDIILDIIVLALPLVPIYRLHIAKHHKIQLFGVFTLGFFCIISSGIRMYYTKEVVDVTLAGGDPSMQLCTWFNVWGELEAAASIVTTCLPTFGPLLAKSHAIARSIQVNFTKFSLRSRESSKQHSDMNSGDGSMKSATTGVVSGNTKLGFNARTYNSVQSSHSSRNLSDDIPGIYIERSFSSGTVSNHHEEV